MVESIMFFGGGFLVAGLLALVLISFVHHRAVRLTQRRLEDAIPVSMAEIQADKDNLRAEFAMSARRLEMSVEQLKAKATNQLGDIARKTEAINRLKAELAEKTAVTDELDAKARSLAGKMRDSEQEYSVKAATVESTARSLATKEAELAKAASDINEQRLATDTQRVEIAVLKTQVEQFKGQIDELQQDAQDAARRLFDERVAVSTITKELEEKRQAVDVLRPQVTQLEREIAAASSELENRSRRIDELEARIGEQDRMLYQRAAEVGNLQQELAASKQAHNRTAERLGDEKSDLERLLGTANNTVESHSARIDDLEKWVAERDRLLSQRDAEARALHEEIAASKTEHNTVAERMQAEKSGLATLLHTANTALEARAGRIADLEGWVADRDALLHQREAEIAALFGQIASAQDEHGAAAERLQAEKTSLEKLLQTANQTLDTRVARIEDLENWVAERDDQLRRRDIEVKALFQDIATIKQEASAAAEQLRAEKAHAERQLQSALADRSQAQIELNALKHEAEATWRTERTENGMLRERINDIAARVAHMVLTTDKSAAPIATIMAESAGNRLETFERAANRDVDAPPEGNLTDRIRKLQSGAPRVSNAS
jgi:chromosome segregation ATPase